MGKAVKLIRAVAFLLVFGLVFIHVQELVTPDYNWPGSFDRLGNGVRGLYKEPDDSLQVLWLGTSHMRNAVSPMLIYRDTGIRSYNLSCGDQTIALSWSRLKRVMQRQSPQVVFLDVSACFHSKEYCQGQKGEASWRKVIDSLSWYRLADKFAMSDDMVKSSDWDESEMVGGILPLVRYHTNYLLDESAFENDNAERVALLKGYCQMEYRKEMDIDALDGQQNEAAQEPTEGIESEEKLQRLKAGLDYNRQYVENMAALCRERGCELVLTKTPLVYWTRERHQMIEEMAEEIGCRFVDLNYEDTGIVWALDSSDVGRHMNTCGAKKVSAFYARWLAENCDIDGTPAGVLVDRWDEQLRLYEWEDQFYILQTAYSLDQYLDLLGGGDYTIFVMVSGPIGDRWTQEDQKALADATGAQLNLLEDDAVREGEVYLLASENGKLLEEKADAVDCAAKGWLANDTKYVMTGKMGKTKVKTNVSIDGMDFSNSDRGIFFVVYANELQCVIDSVCFDTGAEGVPFKRNLKGTRAAFRRALMERELETLKDI